MVCAQQAGRGTEGGALEQQRQPRYWQRQGHEPAEPTQRHASAAKADSAFAIEPNRPLALYRQAPAAIKSIANQEMTGGPRGGSGAAVRAAMCAAGMGSRACASGCTSGSRVCDIGGGAPTCTHSGQSSVWLGMSCAPSSVLTTSLTAPEPRQINSTGLGWTKGDATATPIDNTNHANTRRASHRRLRRVCRGTGGMWRNCRRPLRRAG